MTQQKAIRSYEYKNDYLYIVIRQMPEQGPQTYLYCCGINIARFDPICWKKAGICSNPAFKGLQLLRADVAKYASGKRVQPKNAGNIPCGPMTPGGNGWYRETPMLLEGAPPKTVQDILEFSVMDLVRTVLYVCAPEVTIPAKLPNPPSMQKWLDSLNVRNYKQAPPIAKPQE
ncbi:MAG TPA: hypothetical protein VIX18_12110 [Nitrospirota bacterium]